MVWGTEASNTLNAGVLLVWKYRLVVVGCIQLGQVCMFQEGGGGVLVINVMLCSIGVCGYGTEIDAKICNFA